MKGLRSAILAGFFACAAGCAQRGPTYDGAATYGYLSNVGLIRAKMNADNRERIPALVHAEDPAPLSSEASKMEQFRVELGKLSTDQVDPDALHFTQSLEEILAGYEAICSDSAELYRELANQDQHSPGHAPTLAALKGDLKGVQVDAIGAAGTLVDAMSRLPAPASGSFSFDAVVQKLHDDQVKLVDAKEAHHRFTDKIKGDFAQRYPGKDWASKEILP